MQKILITSAIMRRGKEIKDGTVLQVGKDITSDEAEKFISMECAEEYDETSDAMETQDTPDSEPTGSTGDEEEASTEDTEHLDKEALLKSISEAESREAIDELMSEVEEPAPEIVEEIHDAIRARVTELEDSEQETLDEKLAAMDLEQLREALTDKGISFHPKAKEPNLRGKLKEAIEEEASA